MPYETVEKVKNNSDFFISSIDQFREYLVGGRSIENQAERIRLAGLDIGLSDAVCNELKNEITKLHGNPNGIVLSDLNVSDQTIIRTTLYPSEEIYNNIILIRNYLDKGSTSWSLISSRTI